MSQRPNLTANEKCEMIVSFAEDIKAESIDVLDVGKKTSIADFFVICTGTSDVHVNAIVGRVEEKMLERGVKPLRQETQGAGWLLLDYGDIVFHVMREEKRQFYDLETLWETTVEDPNLA